MSCMVYGCTNNSLTSDSSIKYYPFPKTAYAQKWIEACGWQSNTLFLDTACICSIHFDETAFESKIEMVNFAACYTKSLKCDAVPTLYLPEAQILIKDNSMDVTNQVVVYTINSGSDDGITSISLESGVTERQMFELQPSLEKIKIETQTMSLKNEILDQREQISDQIKSYPPLKIVQGHNKTLRKKVAKLESELERLKNDLLEKEKKYAKLGTDCKNLETEVTNIKTLSQNDQEALLSKVFSEAQIKILFGKKKVYWSNDDMAVGYIIRHLSNKRCYNYLTKTLNIPLPGLSSIKRWVTAKKTKRIRR